MKKKKVVILGGGVSSMSVAWELTSQSDWKDRYESITVYQQGWRLGGKGASGRNLKEGRHARIEEHGLHIWMGWYHNAFKMIRACYEELGRHPDQALSTWQDAFKRHGFINIGEQRPDGPWTNWPLEFPLDDELPGQGHEMPDLWFCIHRAMQGLEELLEGKLLTAPRTPWRPKHGGLLGLIERLAHTGKRLLKVGEESTEIAALMALLKMTRSEILLAEKSGLAPDSLIDLLKSLRQSLIDHLKHWIDEDDESRRLFIVLDLGLTAISGVMSSGLSRNEAHCLDSLDDLDFREFLRLHGAQESTIHSSLTLAFYDLLFAYRDGDPKDQRVATGVALRFIYRMVLGYKGAIFWKMQAGMGDTVFTPLHQVLEKRGVEFKFFHAVRNLELSKDDPKRVARIHIGKQATVKENSKYRPYPPAIQGLDCWPSEPLYEQLVEGDELCKQGINLESHWTQWQDREAVVLEADQDFDEIVFGISIASIPFVADELLKASPRWQDSVKHVETVRTQAVQIWMKPNWQELGWTLPSAVTDTYPEPLDTWADMTHLLPREDWPVRCKGSPKSLVYFCAPMRGGIPPLSDHDAPEQAALTVRKDAIEWLELNSHIMWPRGTSNNGGLNWDLVVDDNDGVQGQARFDSQFWRANIDPSERYVMSVPNSTQHRIKAHEPEFSNLFVTGDWTYTGVNAGCVEGAVMAGQLTANAMSGYPALDDIIGFNGP